MKTHNSILLLLMVSFAVSAHSRDVIIRPEVLKGDLDDILRYYGKSDDTADVFMRWPQSITFRIKREERESYLRICGEFKIPVGDNTLCYDGLYYTSNQFYVKESNAGELQPIESDKELYYVAPTSVSKQKPYVSINYVGFDEKESKRVIALASCHEEHGDVRILIGTSDRNQVKVKETIVKDRSKVRGNVGISYINKDYKNYLGFCDTGTGYMTIFTTSGVLMISRSDIYE